MAEEERVEEFPAADAAYDVAMRRLDDQMRQIDTIDNKIALVIGSASAVAALFAGFAATTIDTSETASLLIGAVALILVGAIYAPTVFIAFRACWFYEWSLRPNWNELVDLSRTNSDRLMRSWVAANCIRSLETNADQIDNKLGRAGLSFKFLMVQGLAVVIGMIAIMLANGITF